MESIMALARGTKKKEDRLELRLDSADRRLLDEAAAMSSMSTSAFVLSHATTAAHEILAEQVRFVLPTQHWDTFLDLLDRDEQPVRGLAALFAGPSVEDLE
jgi:uncharacterized protein (DUF1778 family)